MEISKKIIKNGQGAILCPKHKIIADSFCLEENCQNKITCIRCIISDKHNHNINIGLSSI